MEKLTLPPGVTHRHEPDVDIVAWSTTRESLSWISFLVLCIAVVLVVGSLLLFTYHLFSGSMSEKSLGEQAISLIFYGLVWFMFVGVLFTFESMNWVEGVQISDTDLVVIRSGRFAPKKNKRFYKNVVLGLALDRLESDDSFPNLYIFYGNLWGFAGGRHEVLATWMRTKYKRQLFRLLQQILDAREWHIAYRENTGWRTRKTTVSSFISNANMSENGIASSQEAINFVVNELRAGRNRNDIIVKLCQRTGCQWDEASALVQRFESAALTELL